MLHTADFKKEVFNKTPEANLNSMYPKKGATKKYSISLHKIYYQVYKMGFSAVLKVY
jgi:hypothetical protein